MRRSGSRRQENADTFIVTPADRSGLTVAVLTGPMLSVEWLSITGSCMSDRSCTAAVGRRCRFPPTRSTVGVSGVMRAGSHGRMWGRSRTSGASADSPFTVGSCLQGQEPPGHGETLREPEACTDLMALANGHPVAARICGSFTLRSTTADCLV